MTEATNVVTMDNGNQVNFGNRTNLVSKLDLAKKAINFSVRTGVSYSWDVADLAEGLNPFQNKNMHSVFLNTSIFPGRIAIFSVKMFI